MWGATDWALRRARCQIPADALYDGGNKSLSQRYAGNPLGKRRDLISQF